MAQTSEIGAAARMTNAALKPLEFLIGDWDTTGTHPMLPGQTLKGRTSFAWHEGGAFLIVRNEIDDPQFPSGVAIIGSDDVAKTFSMIYFDERGISRHMDVSVGDRTVTWRRDNPELAQSLTITAQSDGTLVSEGRMSEKGGPWGKDLSQIFTRGLA